MPLEKVTGLTGKELLTATNYFEITGYNIPY